MDLDTACDLTGRNCEPARQQLRHGLYQPPGRVEGTVAVFDSRRRKIPRTSVADPVADRPDDLVEREGPDSVAGVGFDYTAFCIDSD